MKKAKEKYYDAISYFDYVQNIMLDKVNEMEKICLNAEKKEMAADVIRKLKDLNESFHNVFLRYYTLQEDVLFPELEKVLPSPTSTTSMRTEHSHILQLNNTISEKLSDMNPTEKDRLVSTIYSFTDTVQRHFHKKNDVMYHEVSSFLSEPVLTEIYDKMKRQNLPA